MGRLLKEHEIQVGKTYRAKNPQAFAAGVNDRTVTDITPDGLVVYTGLAKHSTRDLFWIPMRRFLAWAGREVVPKEYVYVVVETGAGEPKLLWATRDKAVAHDYCNNTPDRFVHVEAVELREEKQP